MTLDEMRALDALKTWKELEEARGEIARLTKERDEARARVAEAIADRDSARGRADQVWKLRSEFAALLGTDDIEKGVETVKGLLSRVKRLEEAGDELLYNNDDIGNINRWHKAKEAKP